ncbi:MAG: ABC transporter permease subunit [Acidimicrobiales bacterium]|nr:ABC transporter permease subunit [Acidimicrobiales bacterium]
MTTIGSDWSFLGRATKITVWNAVQGFAWGLLAGVGLSVAGLLIKPLNRSIGRLATLLNSIPWIAIGPLTVMVISSSATPVVFAILAVFFSSFVTISSGLRRVEKAHLDLFNTLGARRLTTFRRLECRVAIPSIVYAAKLGAPAAMFGAVFGEWFGTTHPGLGLVMVSALQNYMTLRLWAAALLAAGASVAIYGLFAVVEVALVGQDYQVSNELADSTGVKRVGRRNITTGVDRVLAAFRSVGNALLHGWPILAVIGFWQYAVSVWDVSPIVAPSPISVLRDLFSESNLYLVASLQTVQFAVIGLIVGTIVGCVVALCSWFATFLQSLFGGPMIMLYSVPLVAIVPILARVFGYSRTTEVLIAALVSMFPTFVLVSAGLRAVPAGANDLFTAMGTSKAKRLRYLAIPSAVPNFLTVVRLTSSVAFVAAILGEYLTGQAGLGWMFALANGAQDMPRAWGAAVIIVLLSVLTYMAFSKAEEVGQKRVL